MEIQPATAAERRREFSPGLQPGVRAAKTASPGRGVGTIARRDLGPILMAEL